MWDITDDDDEFYNPYHDEVDDHRSYHNDDEYRSYDSDSEDDDAEQEIWKRVLLHKMDYSTAAASISYGRTLHHGTHTALYNELQEVLLHYDRISRVGLQMTIQSMDPAVVSETDEFTGETTVRRLFESMAVRPPVFKPNPDIW